MGDAALSSDAFMYNFQSAAFFTNYIELIRDDQNPDASIPDVVPFMRYGGRPADPSWSAAYIQLLYCMFRYFGDFDLIADHLPNMISYLDFVTAKVTQSGMNNFYFSYGDWVPPPPATKVDSQYLSATSYLRNIQQTIEMARAVGNTTAVDQLSSLLVTQTAAFNAAFFHSENSYDNGVQTALSFALQLDAVPTPINTTGVYYNLLNDIVVSNNGHFTTGISGFKSLWTVLTAMGRMDLVHQLATCTDYPSMGWMITNPWEPATTVWELMDAYAEGPGMNSRSHHMWSSFGQMMYENLAGMSQPLPYSSGASTRPSVGWENVVIRPPAGAMGLSQASMTYNSFRGKFMSEWQRHGGTQCAKVRESWTLALDCGSMGGVIQSIDFASFGQPIGGCGGFGINAQCNSANSLSVVQQACVGKQSCTIVASNAVFGGDPCNGSVKWLSVQAYCSLDATLVSSVIIPTGSTATVALPVYAMTSPTITESGAIVYQNGNFVSGVSGMISGESDISTNSVVLQVLSGSYSFVVAAQSHGTYVCGNADELSPISLSCSSEPGTVITRIAFASYGTPPNTCGNPPFTISDCHAGTSKQVFEDACVGESSCTVDIGNDVFGMDPCVGVHKYAVVNCVCASP